MNATVSTADVIRFIQTHASKGPGSWPEPVLAQWLTTRADRGELRVLVDGDRVTSVAVCTEKESGEVHVDLIIGHWGHIPGMLRDLVSRWPDWSARTFTAVRNGNHRKFPMAHLIHRLEIA
jgi:hypothetical protein